MSDSGGGPTFSIRLPDVSRLTPALDVVAGALFYGQGLAISRFVGIPTDPDTVALGLLVVVSGHGGLHFLAAFLRARSKQGPYGPEDPSAPLRGPIRKTTRAPFLGAVLTLTLWATGLSAAVLQESFPPLAWAFLALAFIVGWGWVHPSSSLPTSGYGEIALSIAMAGLIPAFAFSLQSSELHPLLLFSAGPLIALHFAMLIVFQLRRFGHDSRLERKTLSVRVGWPSAMRAHDAALLTGLLLVAAGPAVGMPNRVWLGFLLVVPLAGAQIWQMARIRRGFPARWGMTSAVAMATFGLALYLELTGYLLTMA